MCVQDANYACYQSEEESEEELEEADLQSGISSVASGNFSICVNASGCVYYLPKFRSQLVVMCTCVLLGLASMLINSHVSFLCSSRFHELTCTYACRIGDSCHCQRS